MEHQGILTCGEGPGRGAGTQAFVEKKDAPKVVLIYKFDAESSTATKANLVGPAVVLVMYSGMDRSDWQQPAYPERASPPPQSQTGWFPLQDTEQQQQQSPVSHHSPSGWLQDAAGNAGYATSPSHDSRGSFVSSPIFSSVPPAESPPYLWTEQQAQPPPARVVQFLPSPTYQRPIMLPDSELCQDQKAHVQTVLRRNKQIAIGRWNSEEHQWFLKGLEMFQGPAWGEIARLIGTRTSTQVRTHAQKFFTKLARLNQTMPYFEVQIQKERARLVAQGASVTPTAQSTSLPATLSPRKRLASTSNSPRQSLQRYKEEVVTSPTYASAAHARYPQEAYNAKPRVYAGDNTSAVSPSSGPAMRPQQWTSDDTRHWPLASPTSTAASLRLTQMQMADVGQQSSPTAASDADSLPSMNKLLHRSSNTATTS
ncbi:Myb-like DNA-binding domain [Phytophthora infestans]|uniref:Myb-like DNA-binding domain n=1 Tax=Phytophthora infestans TaxID=4787 RepID=A0A833VYL5_PHYIN|nr:Myb-like DNA-binding domain [Phytophthora infestans]